MSKILKQSVSFNVSASFLYTIYMDSKKHSAAIGAPVKIGKKVGDGFSAHGDYIKGKNLLLKKNKMIVQTWRGSDWDKKDEDSIFMLTFEEKGKDKSTLHMVHANVPDKYAKGIDQGWKDYYWVPWKDYLKSI